MQALLLGFQPGGTTELFMDLGLVEAKLQRAMSVSRWLIPHHTGVSCFMVLRRGARLAASPSPGIW